MTQSDVEREKYESREKALRDYRSGIDWALEKGLEQGRREELINSLEFALELKFGEAAKVLFPGIRLIADITRLRAMQQAIRTATTPDELRSFVAPT